MINKIYKIINNKFSRFFKFIFFLKYLFVIFFVATALFLTIPHFFDYQKKERGIKSYMFQNLGLDIKSFEKIKFNSFPTPHYELKKIYSNFDTKEINLNADKLVIFPKLTNIYNFENLIIKKIEFENARIVTNTENVKFLINKIFNQKNKINFTNMNIQIKDKDPKINLIDLRNVDYANFGYQKNTISGKIFDKKFLIKIKKNYQKYDFKLLNTGIFFTLDFDENYNFSNFKGIIKGKILDSSVKLDFHYNDDQFAIKNLFFREKNLAFDSKGFFSLKPYFNAELTTEIKRINPNLIKKLSRNYTSNFKDIIKKINSQNTFFYKSKKFNRDLFDEFKIDGNLIFGRLEMSKEILIANSKFNCLSDIDLIDEYPVLSFDCTIKSPDKRKLLKKFKVDYKTKNENLDIYIKGSINILSSKINFEKINVNNNYEASNGDLKYFKNTFESILLDDGFLNIFEFIKIKKFILTIS